MRSLLFLLLAPVLLFSCKTRTAEGKAESATLAATTPDRSVQFADEKFTDIIRRNDIMFTNGNIDGWAKMFTNDALLLYSNGDKVAGRKAIVDFWTNRRNTLVQSVTHNFDIFLPVQVKETLQPGTKLPGVWLMHWTQCTTKYNNGKTITGWIHCDYHFNDNDQVDRMILYQDMGPLSDVSGERSMVPAR